MSELQVIGLGCFLTGMATGIGLLAWILHRTDKHLEARTHGQVGP